MTPCPHCGFWPPTHHSICRDARPEDATRTLSGALKVAGLELLEETEPSGLDAVSRPPWEVVP